MRRSKWNLLYGLLILLLLLSLVVIPKITIHVLNETKGKIIFVQSR
ncbi:hypothetical protein [Bacillus niameyensis]|nr:hypothetical protein [Bacillus niameyensis]